MWKIKDPELKLKVNQLVVSDDRIATCCREQMKDPTDFILLESEVFKLSMRVDKDYFEEVPEYNPDDWNPFPQIKPPAYCHWLVQFESGEIKVIEYVRQEFSSFSVGDFWNAPKLSKVIAFRKLPEPFQPEETK